MSENLDVLRPKIGVGVIVIQDNKVLFGKRIGSHGGGLWSFPGGHLEFGETPEECAQRELLEETGLIASSVARGPWVNNFFYPDKHYVTLFIFVREFTGTIANLEPHKCEGWEWFAWDNLPTPLFSTISELIKIEGINSLMSSSSIISEVSQ